jgi:hypothetical protein
MPAARVDGEPWQLESAEILQRVGYDTVSPKDLREMYNAWNGVFHRPDSAARFFGGFSLIRDPNPSLLLRLRNHFLRSFGTLYFFLLIRTMVLLRRPQDPVNHGDQFLYWERKLEESSAEFLGGDAPDILDVMLFGILQCHCSIPVPPSVALQQDPRLAGMRRWIGAMQERFVGYPHLYSGVYFEPHASAPVPCLPLERAAFWLGTIFMIAAFPITVPLIFYFASRARRRPADE